MSWCDDYLDGLDGFTLHASRALHLDYHREWLRGVFFSRAMLERSPRDPYVNSSRGVIARGRSWAETCMMIWAIT